MSWPLPTPGSPPCRTWAVPEPCVLCCVSGQEINLPTGLYLLCLLPHTCEPVLFLWKKGEKSAYMLSLLRDSGLLL